MYIQFAVVQVGRKPSSCVNDPRKILPVWRIISEQQKRNRSADLVAAPFSTATDYHMGCCR
jgi:hypothetical protein